MDSISKPFSQVALEWGVFWRNGKRNTKVHHRKKVPISTAGHKPPTPHHRESLSFGVPGASSGWQPALAGDLQGGANKLIGQIAKIGRGSIGPRI